MCVLRSVVLFVLPSFVETRPVDVVCCNRPTEMTVCVSLKVFCVICVAELYGDFIDALCCCVL